jgi:ATP phosphoribosyltransferase
MLRLVLPKGSLEAQTLELFDAADLQVKRSSSVDYRATIDDPRVAEVRILRPQEIPIYLEEGIFDLGITGRDWIEETGAEVVSLCELAYSKRTAEPVRLVLAVDGESKFERPEDLPQDARISTEYPRLTARWLADRGIKADVRLSYGATEAKVPEIAEAIVELTETGRALRAAGLRIIATVLESHTELVASPAAMTDPAKVHAMEQIRTLLSGALDARGRVLVKLNVSDANLEQVISVLPSMKSPTVSKLFGDGGYAVETVVLKSEINILIPELVDRGASDILELPLSKIVVR